MGRGMTGAMARAALARKPMPEWGVRHRARTSVQSARIRCTTGPRASSCPVAHAAYSSTRHSMPLVTTHPPPRLRPSRARSLARRPL
eukprot:scaffold4939_cov121-Isochrysis_galbana.AAC.10